MIVKFTSTKMNFSLASGMKKGVSEERPCLPKALHRFFEPQAARQAPNANEEPCQCAIQQSQQTRSPANAPSSNAGRQEKPY